ncbi:hypothetical protein VTK73DRAFT_5484 [Phialemonium thermophilum]|uniref:Uncharacterized protein n=1 Tax=Phialemonium thermophilum TaxID=223376 RepID=A0ABR3V1I2_9PEZI
MVTAYAADHSNHYAPERCADSEVLHEIVDVGQVPRQELLLLLRRPSDAGRGRLATPTNKGTTVSPAGPPGEGSRELAGAALQLSRGGGGVQWRLGHEVEVEELDELELDVARGGAAAEEGGDGQEAVLSLEGAGVAGAVDEGDDEEASSV